MFVPRATAILAASLALALPLVSACSNGAPSGGSSTTTSSAPRRMTFSVILLDDQPDPFAKLPEPVPKGISTFQEPVIPAPEQIELHTFVRLVVQPGETLDQARARARPWFDAIRVPRKTLMPWARPASTNAETSGFSTPSRVSTRPSRPAFFAPRTSASGSTGVPAADSRLTWRSTIMSRVLVGHGEASQAN